MSDQMNPIEEPSADEQLAKELVERARSEGVQLVAGLLGLRLLADGDLLDHCDWVEGADDAVGAGSCEAVGELLSGFECW